MHSIFLIEAKETQKEDKDSSIRNKGVGAGSKKG